MSVSQDEERKKRLAQALRDNLKKRKAQARARRAVVPAVAEGEEPAGETPRDSR